MTSAAHARTRAECWDAAAATEGVHLFALGGLGEIGMNCLALAYQREVVLIDCGVTFPDRPCGANLIHPAFEAVLGEPLQVVGLVLTHGHEDHIGGVPYLLYQKSVPIWGPGHAIALVEDRLQEHALERPAFHTVDVNQPFQVGPFQFEMIRVTHSIVDATAVCIDTPAGRIVHSGDFKIDPSPSDGEHFHASRLEELGNEGVALLLSDSTNSFVNGEAGSEARVAEALGELVASASGAVVVGLFASNVHRLRLVTEVARATRRRVLPLGHSVRRHLRVAQATNHLPPLEDLLVSPKEARRLPRAQLLVVATGSQGEPRAALARLSRKDHPDFSLLPGDRVLFSSRVIPGNEREVFALINRLARQEIDVRFGGNARSLHVSGHACRQEQAALLSLVRPRSFVPVHGTLVHLQEHAKLARETGIQDVWVVENGTVLRLDSAGLDEVGQVSVGRVFVDRNFEEVSRATLRDRARLAESGLALAMLPTGKGGHWTGTVTVFARGLLPKPDDDELLLEAADYVARTLRGHNSDDSRAAMAEAAGNALSRFFRRELGIRPLCDGVFVS